MGMGPRFPVEAPPRVAPRIGLIPSSATNQGANVPAWMADDPDARWRLGFAFQPEQCGDVVIDNPCDATQEVIHSVPPRVKYDPFTVQASESCWAGSSLDALRDERAKVVRALDRMTPKGVEQEFWSGEFSATTPGVNNYLTNPGSLEDITPSGTALSPLDYALADLQQYLADCGDGGPGMIHAPRRLVTLWQRSYLVSREPGSLILRDLYENIVVPGVGYDGSGPRVPGSTLIGWSVAPTSGNVTYTFPGYTAVTVAFNATVAALETALEAVLGVGTISGISGSTVNVNHTITWGGTLQGYAPEPAITTSVNGAAIATGNTGPSPSDPGGETVWAYATSLTQVRLSNVEVYPNIENLGGEGGAMLFEENEVELFANRLAAVTFDGCCHAAIEVDICNTCCVGEGGS